MRLRAKWLGAAPRIGDYLRCPRGRYAYCIRGISCVGSIVRWDAAAKAESRRLVIEVDRVAAADVPPNVWVHAWSWDKRQSRHAARR